jgi:hypothetical protein
MSAVPEERRVANGVRHVPERSQALFQFAILAIAVFGYLWLLWQIRDGRYMPAWSDEYSYYVNTRSYVENGRLEGAILIEENVSPLGQFDAHGFAYTLLHGLIARVFGFHRLNMILFNLACLLLALVAVLRFDVGAAQKAALASSIMLYMTVPIWLFTYMQETMQIGVGVLAGLLLWKLYAAEAAGRRRYYAVAYLAVLVVASLFRPSWAFCTVGLLPLAANRRQALFISGIVLAAVGASFLYIRFLCASYPYGFLVKAIAELQAGRVFGFLGQLFTNFITNVRYFYITTLLWPMGVSESAWIVSRIGTSYVLSKYILTFLCGFCLWQGFSRRDRLAQAVGIIVALNLLVLLFLYDTRDWMGPRTVAAMFPLLMVGMLRNRRVMAVIPFALLILFPQAMSFTEGVVIATHRHVAAEYESNIGARDTFAEIGRQITEPRLTTVLASRFFYAMEDIPLLALPVRSRAGQPIRYTFNVLGDDELELKKPGFVDYILVPDTIVGTTAEPAHVKLRLVRVAE